MTKEKRYYGTDYRLGTLFIFSKVDTDVSFVELAISLFFICIYFRIRSVPWTEDLRNNWVWYKRVIFSIGLREFTKTCHQYINRDLLGFEFGFIAGERRLFRWGC